MTEYTVKQSQHWIMLFYTSRVWWRGGMLIPITNAVYFSYFNESYQRRGEGKLYPTSLQWGFRTLWQVKWDKSFCSLFLLNCSSYLNPCRLFDKNQDLDRFLIVNIVNGY